MVVRLDQAIEDYRHRTGHRMPWVELAYQVGLTDSTLRAMRKPGYNTTLRTLEAIAAALDMKALDLLDEIPDSEAP